MRRSLARDAMRRAKNCGDRKDRLLQIDHGCSSHINSSACVTWAIWGSSMAKLRVHQGHAVPDFVVKFGVALDYFSLKVRETAHIRHAGSKGTERELDVQSFIESLLPDLYAAKKGEVVDLKGQKSPQMDVIIYDRQKNFPFYSGDIVIIPAEALLSSIEVKSKLNYGEISTSQQAALKLKKLEPMKRPLATAQENSAGLTGAYRFFHCLFAFDTDLSASNWPKNELERLESSVSVDQVQSIDLVYVLKRGLINVRARTFIPENEDTGQALVAFHYTIYNFIDRENRRRPRAPYFSYATDLNKYWQKI